MEEFFVQWDPKDCTLQEDQTQQALGFVITAITIFDTGVPTPLIQVATANKRPRGRPKTSERIPSDTKFRVQFAPSPQGPTHIRTIRGGDAALYDFLLAETTRPPAIPLGHSEPSGPTPATRSPRVHTPPARRGDHPHLPHIRLLSGAASHPHRLGRPTERTHTCSKLSRRRGTRTEILSPERDPTFPSYHHHPHGTHWGQT